ncbi:Polygalacturonase 1 [Ranunculus cassubicifolius]
MALFLPSHTSFLLQNPKSISRLRPSKPSLSISPNPNSSSFRINSDPASSYIRPIPVYQPDNSGDKPSTNITDEWGEKSEPEPELSSYTDADPAKDDDEWGGGEEEVLPENGSATTDKLGELKRSLVDTFYCTDLGFNTSPEVRAEVTELVSQLEAVNPTPVSTESPALDGNWVLLYTAFSELLPLLAAGTTPLLKLEKIGQSINTKTLTIENSTTFSNPLATFSFSASATFEVRSPSRIQVTFKEGILNPPKIISRVSLPENLDIFGQTLDLSIVQRSLDPLQEIVGNISRLLSGQPPLKVPIPGDRSSSWLLTTYLDNDLRISRGDGGLFILAKEGSPLLDPY